MDNGDFIDKTKTIDKLVLYTVKITVYHSNINKENLKK